MGILVGTLQRQVYVGPPVGLHVGLYNMFPVGCAAHMWGCLWGLATKRWLPVGFVERDAHVGLELGDALAQDKRRLVVVSPEHKTNLNNNDTGCLVIRVR